ncbi:MAG: hypothetical protein ACP5HG_01050 [Anaerolineae bacterium]
MTRRQRLILLALAISVVAVFGVLGRSVWLTLQQQATVSPLATAMVSTGSPLMTPTRRPSPTLEPTATPPTKPTFDVSKAGVIASGIAEARGARSRWGTPLTLVDDTDMARALYAHYQTSPPLVMRARPALSAFGLWFWDALRLDLVGQSELTAAFYGPESEELVLRQDWPGPLETLEAQLAYGYARALPDQVGGLTALMREASSLDRWLALAAVAEGDAMVSVLLHHGIAPGSAAAAALQAQVSPAVCPLWQVSDPLLEDLSCLKFELGAAFATSRYQKDGLEALDQATLRPPRSTEQLLHPERYVDADEPDVLPPLAPDLGAAWVPTGTETLGEAIMGVILREWSDEQIGPEAVEDWGGDLLQIWENPDGEILAVWQTNWDTFRATGRFYDALLEVMPRALIPGQARETTAPESLPRGHWWTGRQGTAFLYRRGNRVWLIWGQDSAAVESAGATLP